MVSTKSPQNRRWTVVWTNEVDLRLEADFKSGRLNKEDIRLLKRWRAKVEEGGPESLRKTTYWGDHALYGEWWGYRSSCFSHRGRIIYKVINDRVEVIVVRITPDHNYKKES